MFNNSFHTLDQNSSKSPGEASSTAHRKERAFYININFSKFSDCDSVVSALNMNYKVASNWRNNIFLVENFILYILFFISNYPKNLSKYWFYYSGFDRLYDKTWAHIIAKVASGRKYFRKTFDQVLPLGQTNLSQQIAFIWNKIIFLWRFQANWGWREKS